MKVVVCSKYIPDPNVPVTDEHRIALDFIGVGKPAQNAMLESFNGLFWGECLTSHWFTSLADARNIIEDWRRDYNQIRPHSSVDYHTASEPYYPFTGSPLMIEAAGFS